MFYVNGLNYSTATQPWTVFMAYKWNGVTGGRLLNANTASPDFLMGLWNSPSVMNIAFNGSFVGSSSTASDTNWHFIWMSNDGLSSTNSTKSYIATSVAPSTTNGTRNGSAGFNGLRLFGRFVSSTSSTEPVTADVGFVRDISYKETANYAFSASDLGGVIPLEYMGAGAYGSIAGGINPQQPVWGKMSDWVMYKQYEDMYNRISGQQGGWEWLAGYNTIKLYPVPYRSYPVAVRYLQRRPDFGMVTQAMQEGALAFAKIILGRIRSRIQNPPGPNGGIQLDGQQILQEGIDEKKQWQEDLITRYGDILGPRMM
jgi:hypothetical protein